MADDPRRDAVPQHIAAIAARSDGDGLRLTQTLAGRCWPRGGDRAEPVAAAWLRRWGPARGGAGASSLPACACARRACVVCN
jgi:hypothetical protein